MYISNDSYLFLHNINLVCILCIESYNALHSYYQIHHANDLTYSAPGLRVVTALANCLSHSGVITPQRSLSCIAGEAVFYTSYVAAHVPLGSLSASGCMNMRADAPTFMPYTGEALCLKRP